MWKELVDFLKAVLTLAKDLEQTRTEVKEVRQDITKLTLAVQHLANEIKLAKQEDKSEREKMALQLQIDILKLEKRLPPSTATSDKEKAED